MSLGERMERLGRALGEREAAQGQVLEAARDKAGELHEAVAAGLDSFHAAIAKLGSDHLQIELGRPRVDDKHIRAVQFDLRRGRYCAIVTVKSRGEVTLVGPFQSGKSEGPCRSFPFEADREIEQALGNLLERFIEEATTP